MQIIFEGPDGAGKSTLANVISNLLGLSVTHSGGPSKYPGEVNARARAFNARTEDEVFDRHPAVSQNIYQAALYAGSAQEMELISEDVVRQFYETKPFIVYCRNERGLSQHVMSDHSSSEFFRQVEAHFGDIREYYDHWAMEHASVIYRIGDPISPIVAAIRQRLGREVVDFWGDLVAFHRKFGLSYTGKVRQLPDDLQEFRSLFLLEELREYREAVEYGHKELATFNLNDEAEFVHQLEVQADSLVDLVYVALGTAYLHGFNFEEMWRRVHAANMRKVRASSDGSDSTRKSSLDVVKPAGWEPPKHTDLVEDHSHRAQFSSVR